MWYAGKGSLLFSLWSLLYLRFNYFGESGNTAVTSAETTGVCWSGGNNTPTLIPLRMVNVAAVEGESLRGKYREWPLGS